MSRYWLIAILVILGMSTFLLPRQAGHPPWQLTEVTDHLPDLRFALTDDGGQPVTQKSYAGNVVLLYFGFTQCASACPLTLSRVSAVFKRMGADAEKIRFLFVSIDPEHDRPSTLHAYLHSFDKAHITGLTGSPDAVEELTRRYRAAYQPASGDNPPVHSDTIYIFDEAGHARLIAGDAATDEAIMHDLRQLTHDAR